MRLLLAIALFVHSTDVFAFGVGENILRSAHLNCVGGTITPSGAFNIHDFTASGSLVCPRVKTGVTHEKCGGGGGGGDDGLDTGAGGGGSGGQFLTTIGATLAPGSHSVVIGGTAAGAGANGQTKGSDGNATSFDGASAQGGGGGGGSEHTGVPGVPGGGGKALANNSCGTESECIGAAANGTGTNAGGSGIVSGDASNRIGGGGGGAGGAGADGSAAAGGNGGAGLTSAIDGVCRAGGGGGGSHEGARTSTNSPTCGGGAGGYYNGSTQVSGVNGTANSCGGGGASGRGAGAQSGTGNGAAGRFLAKIPL